MPVAACAISDTGLVNYPAALPIGASESDTLDNSACRDFSGLDTLAASRVLRRLRDRGLLDKEGSGSVTYYVLAQARDGARVASTQLALDIGGESPHGGGPAGGDSAPSMGGLMQSPHAGGDIPPELQARIRAAGAKPRQAEVRALVLALCALRPFTVAALCEALGRRDAKELRRTHLRPLREAGLLALRYPETEKHPHQAYLTVPEDQKETGREA